jgi:hypothetical protein
MSEVGGQGSENWGMIRMIGRVDEQRTVYSKLDHLFGMSRVR